MAEQGLFGRWRGESGCQSVALKFVLSTRSFSGASVRKGTMCGVSTDLQCFAREQNTSHVNMFNDGARTTTHTCGGV